MPVARANRSRTRKAPAPPQRRHRNNARAFLEAYAKCGNVSEACRETGFNRRVHYTRLASDEQYARDFADAQEQANDVLEAEARKRAVDGWDEPVFQGGAQVGVVHKYSDTLLQFLLKGDRPKKFREQHAIEHTGPGGGPVKVMTWADTLKEAAEVARQEGE
jgi:hypothetical protein